MSKLVIEDVSFGKVPYGPGMGESSIAIKFNEADGDYDYPEPEPVEGKKFTEEEKVAHGLMFDLLDKLKEKKLEDKWAEVLLARNYCYFVGDAIAKKDNRKYFLPFLDLVEKSSLSIQLKIIKERVPEAKANSEIMKKLSSPLTAYVGTPLYYTSEDQLYERFRHIIMKYPLEKDANFNQMACVEMGNHVFSVVVLDIKNFDKEKKVIEDKYESIDAITVPSNRVYVIDHVGNQNVAEFAVSKGYRLNRAMDYKGICLDF